MSADRGTLFLVSSSEPRLTQSSATGGQRELTGNEHNPLRSTVPLATHILLVGVMLLFFISATLITLQAGWQWWLIAVAIAIPVIVVLAERIGRVRKAREARRRLTDGIPAPYGQGTGPGRPGSAR